MARNKLASQVRKEAADLVRDLAWEAREEGAWNISGHLFSLARRIDKIRIQLTVKNSPWRD